MRVDVLWFGRPGGSPYEGQVETYRQRVDRRWSAADVPLRPVAAGRDAEPRKALAAEAALARSRVARQWSLVVLDERGTSLDSPGLAGVLRDAEERACPGIAFLIGSDLGVHPDLRREASMCLSLSSMTLPHLLARLVVWEQLFRATQILGGGRYHRQGLQ